MNWKQKFLLIGVGLIAAIGLLELKARADYNVTQGSGTTIFAFTCFTTKVCPAHVNITGTGTEIFTTADPGNVAIPDGEDVALGATADAATTAGGTGSVSAKLRLMTTQLGTIATNSGSSIPAGTAVIGKTEPSFGAAQLTHTVLSFSSSGDNTAVTRTTGTLKVYGLLLSCASSITTMTMKDGASNSLGANQNVTSIFLPIQMEPYYVTTSTNNFLINLSSAISCTGWVKTRES